VIGRRGLAWIAIVGAIAIAPMGCSDDDDEFTGPSNAPADHTISQDGVRHLPGLMEPEQNCTACHGADLRGTASAPSCFTCHGKEWP
jgi:mono/diheme cytochrome c family protein